MISKNKLFTHIRVLLINFLIINMLIPMELLVTITV
jgi:hypothetical protein